MPSLTHVVDVEHAVTAATEMLVGETAARRRLERRVAEQAALLAASPDGIARLGDDGCFAEVNDVVARLLDETPADLVGRSWLARIAPDDRERAQAAATAAAAGDGAVAIEIGCVRRDGARVPALATFVGIAIPGDPSPASFCVLRDLTDRWRAEEEVRATARAAEAASRAKGEFVANMSHEIRTPLNGIIGMAELLVASEVNAEQRSYLETILASGESLGRLINDILDFSKIEASKLDLEVLPFDLRATLADAMRVLALRAHQKGLELACDVPSDVPAMLLGDAGRLRQIVTNLVGNAIKFTETGEIVVRVTNAAPDGEQASLHFSVSDTGIGIPRDKHRAIFEAFTQADASTTRRHGGTGLGLSISSQLVQMMGGRIWVESQPGRGSTFHFTARFGMADTAGETFPAVPLAFDGLRVLVADDSATQRRILAELLRSWRLDPEVAAGGAAAVLAVERAQDAGRPFGLIVLDACMPEVDGFAVAERIAGVLGTVPPTIMLLTPTSPGVDGARCRSLGITTTLTKPIRASDLLDAILVTLGERRAAPDVPPAATRASGPGLRVLVAEDNPINQQIARKMLAREQHTVVVVSDGAEALDALAREPFDLVLMDVQMPRMDGLTAAIEIRRREEGTGRRIPIVAMTAHAMRGDRERCLAAGMDDYVAKPVRGSVLLDVLARYGYVQPSAGARAVRREDAGDPAAAIDRGALAAFVDGDHEMLAAIVHGFVEHGPELLATLRGAVLARDAATVLATAHSLTGSAGLVAAAGVVTLARRLERAAGAGDWATIDTATAALVTEVARVQDALDGLRATPAAPVTVAGAAA